ncbi:hypothetical protein BV22DRAFT_71996 [Leucogyrophana mollusca]|uniref:Uncharacterized protein n=1 Tax=Leucogyrophana mollusca TaxID=85980 RepID=A0ACB8BWI3_9AGAM|nr:hypothetical protein BV22DRAFT_71996 [Leucogyrophana mollusca]
MRWLSTIILLCILAAGFASAHCQYEGLQSLTSVHPGIPWKLHVYSGANCTGKDHEEFRGHLASLFPHHCSDCLKLKKGIDNSVESFVFSAPGPEYSYVFMGDMVLALHLYKNAGCQDGIGKSKGKWMTNTDAAGKAMSAFKGKSSSEGSIPLLTFPILARV